MELFLLTLRQVTRVDPLLMLPPAALLLVYMVFGQTTILGASGFLWSVALFVLLRAGVGLYARRKKIARIFGDPGPARNALAVLQLFALGLAVFILWADNPLYAKRLFTVGYLGLAVFTLFSAPRKAEAGMSWLEDPRNHAIVRPMEVLTAVTIALANEAAIATGGTTLWVAVRVLSPIVLYPIGHWIALLLVVARDVENGR